MYKQTLGGGNLAFFMLEASYVWADSESRFGLLQVINMINRIRTNTGFYIIYDNSQTPVIIIASGLIKQDCPAAVVRTFAFH